MLALSAIVWDMRGLPGAENLPGTAAPERPLSPAEMANLRARELMAARGGIPASDLASKVFGPDDGDALLRHAGVTVTVGGTVREVDLSDDGKSLHLVLQGSNARALRGRIDATNPPQGLSMEELEKLKGRNVELHGEIDAQPYRGGYRARILIDDAADLRVKP